MIGEVISVFLVALSALFFVVDPIGLVPIFVSLTEGHTLEKRKAIAKKACWIFVGVLVFFALGGGVIFKLLGVSLAAFKIAGGILLMLTALDMLRSKQSETRTSDDEIGEAVKKADVTVVPLAMPLLAGPGAIATVMVLTARTKAIWEMIPILVSILATAVVSYLLLAAAHHVDRLLGINGRSILERIMGLLLAAIAVQFVVSGVRDAFPEVFPAEEAAIVGTVGQG